MKATGRAFWVRAAAASLAALITVIAAAGCAAPQRRPGYPLGRPHGDETGRIPRGGLPLADGTLPAGGDRCTASLIGRNGNPNLTGIAVGNVAYIAAGRLPGTEPGLAPYNASAPGQDVSSRKSATGGALHGDGPPNALPVMVDTVRQNCPHLAHIRLANDQETALVISALAGEVAEGRSIAGRLGEIRDLDGRTHIVGAGVTGSGGGGGRGGQTGTGLPNAGGSGP